MPGVHRLLLLALAVALVLASANLPWHPQPAIRCAAGIVLATLLLWITEVAPLGIVALAIPVAAVWTGLMSWSDALAAWGDPILILFLGAFLMARALDKHAAFDALIAAAWSQRLTRRPAGLLLVVLLISGVISTVQTNVAVTVMLLPVVTRLAPRQPIAALALLALSYGSTFGGMATPVGTAPNLIGYRAVKAVDSEMNFISWMAVGVPVWLGTTAIGWLVLLAARRMARRAASGDVATPPVGAPLAATPAMAEVTEAVAVADESPTERRLARRWALIAFGLTASLWAASGLSLTLLPESHALHGAIRRYLPESMIPLVAAWPLFLVRTGASRNTVLDRHDFQALDWDTLFLIAGGLTLGRILETSGSAAAIAAAVGELPLSPGLLVVALAAATVLLSELTSNTATAALLVPLAAPLAPALHLSPTQCILLVTLSASLGFALPVSTPPNAVVYGTRRIRLRQMAGAGLVVDLLCTAWVVACVLLLA